MSSEGTIGQPVRVPMHRRSRSRPWRTSTGSIRARGGGTVVDHDEQDVRAPVPDARMTVRPQAAEAAGASTWWIPSPPSSVDTGGRASHRMSAMFGSKTVPGTASPWCQSCGAASRRTSSFRRRDREPRGCRPRCFRSHRPWHRGRSTGSRGPWRSSSSRVNFPSTFRSASKTTTWIAAEASRCRSPARGTPVPRRRESRMIWKLKSHDPVGVDVPREVGVPLVAHEPVGEDADSPGCTRSTPREHGGDHQAARGWSSPFERHPQDHGNHLACAVARRWFGHPPHDPAPVERRPGQAEGIALVDAERDDRLPDARPR